MRPLVARLAAELAREIDEACDTRLIAYGLEILVDGAIQVLVVLIGALILGLFRPVILVMATAMVYRRFSGGVHCTGFYRCMAVSTVVFLGLGYLAVLLAQSRYCQLVQGLCLLVSLGVLAKWVPGYNPVKPVTDKRRESELRRKSLVVVLGVTAVTVINWWRGPFSPLTLTAVSLGLAWQSFTVTPWGYRLVGCADAILAGAWAKKRGEANVQAD